MKRQISAVLLIVVGGACGGSGPTGVSAAPDEVVIQGFAFSPSPRTISVGTTLTWVNHDGTAHTTTGGTGAETWNSGTLGENGRFSHTFTSPGSYQYVCSIHPEMHGTIVVN
jgi:plastocyanin